MKKGLVFILGLVSGIIMTVASLFIIGYATSSKMDSNIKIAEQQIPFTTATRFKIFQVGDHGALANCEENDYSEPMFKGPVVFIQAEGNNQFYDDQIVEVPVNKKAMQVGTFRYETRLGEKVVPIIKFM